MNADEKKCPRCAETVKAEAVVCRFCGYNFETGQTPEVAQAAAASKPRNQLGCGSAIILAIVALFFLGKCSGDDTTATSTAALDEPAIGLTPAVDLPNWTYSTDQDEVRGKPINYATATSHETHDIGFPYNSVSLNIVVRKHPRYGTDVIFQVSEGQINCPVSDDCYGMIKFDEKPAERLTLNEPGDHSNEYVFARYDEAILRSLKRSKKVVVELPFFQAGNQQFTFDTEGLEWPPKG